MYAAKSISQNFRSEPMGVVLLCWAQFANFAVTILLIPDAKTNKTVPLPLCE